MWSRTDGLGAILAAATDLEAGESLSALGGEPLLALAAVDAGEAREAVRDLRLGAPILVGIDEAGDLPGEAASVFDVLLTTAPSPPRPWIDVGAAGVEAMVSMLRANVARCPAAAAVFATVLRLGEGMDFDRALTLESMAYSTLLGGKEFRDWRSGHPPRLRPAQDAPMVRIDRRDDVCMITLARPNARNAIGARLRDELTEALRLARLDLSIESGSN